MVFEGGTADAFDGSIEVEFEGCERHVKELGLRLRDIGYGRGQRGHLKLPPGPPGLSPSQMPGMSR